MKKEKKEILEKYKRQIKEAITDLKTPGKRHRQIPNILTVMRLFSPCFILPVAATGNAPLTIALAAGFGLTDLADGFIARNWKLTSELGKDLDAAVDKVFASTLLLAGAFANPALLSNLALEGIIAGININQKVKGNEPSSTIVGKIKTFFLFALAAAGLASPLLKIPGLVGTLAVGTGLLQALTVDSYITKYRKAKSNRPASEKKIETIEPIIEEKEEDSKAKAKSREYESPSISLVSENEELLDQLRQMSNLFHQEQANIKEQQADNQHVTGVQKKKTPTNN